MFWVLIFFAKIVFLQSNIQTIAGYAVAPYVGAWIETDAVSSKIMRISKSHPMWVRGLKLRLEGSRDGCLGVAPYVGAWIETTALRRL